MSSDRQLAIPSRKLRTVVIEDELHAREYIVELIEGSNIAEVVGAIGTIADARNALDNSAGLGIDAAFVDVRLAGSGDASGLELVRSLAGKPGSPHFVLATAFAEHAIEAFRLDVVDYLLKPFTEERVEQCLRRLLARCQVPSQNEPQATSARRIIARRAKALVFLEIDEVWALEARDRLTSVHTPHGEFDLDLSLSVIELSFGRAFTRVHRNWLVNAAFIKELERDGRDTSIFVGVGPGAEQRGLRIPVGRDRVQAVRDMLFSDAAGTRRTP